MFPLLSKQEFSRSVEARNSQGLNKFTINGVGCEFQLVKGVCVLSLCVSYYFGLIILRSLSDPFTSCNFFFFLVGRGRKMLQTSLSSPIQVYIETTFK